MLSIVEEILNGLPEFLFCPVETGIDDLLAEEFPKPLNQIEVRRVGRQEYLPDFCPVHPFLELFVVIITGIVGNDIDERGLRMPVQGSQSWAITSVTSCALSNPLMFTLSRPLTVGCSNFSPFSIHA